MDYRNHFYDFAAHMHMQKGEGPTREHPIAHQVFPGVWGSRRSKENTVFVSARQALHLCALTWKLCPNERIKQRYAASLMARLGSEEYAHLRGKSAWLRRAIDPYVRGPGSVFVGPANATLWHIDGRKETGNQPALSQLTGLPSGQVRDLVSGRRTYAKGWCTSPEEAAKGLRKTGRPAARPHLFF